VSSPSSPSLVLYSVGGEPTPVERKVIQSLGVSGSLSDANGIPESLPPGGGWIVVPSAVAESSWGRVLRALGRSPEPWSLLLLERDEDAGEVKVLPVSPGYPETPEAAAGRVTGDGLAPGYMGHRRVLLDLSRIRHDVNNALTAALAEAQMLQMDADRGSELHEALGVVEAQLQRIRSLVSELGALRVVSR
jgi:signal transduction histidine kinase